MVRVVVGFSMAAPAKVDSMRPLDGVLWVSTTQWKPFRDVSFVINFVFHNLGFR